jgi:ectoine hydroxylase-related dioxygenase (phytanoyl-CoA dioxygenase family)
MNIMVMPEISYNTQEYEVVPELDKDAVITQECARRICETLDKSGFVVIPGMLSGEEAERSLCAVQAVLSDPERQYSSFASEVDSQYQRRDFCPLPASDNLLLLAATLCQRSRRVLKEYCGASRSVLEMSTLTSYAGSSHQYIHRDPNGVIGILAALTDVGPEQGGTVFVPGTHKICGGEFRFSGYGYTYMEVFRSICNLAIMGYNLKSLKKMRKLNSPPVSWKEYWERVYSVNTADNHQPNLSRFLLGDNEVFDRTNFGFRSLLRFFRYRKKVQKLFQLVQVAPAKGTVIIYRSDIFHAGPDNRSDKPRHIYSLNLARDVVHPKLWKLGYAPHPTLLEKPLTLGSLLNVPIDMVY